MTAWADWPRSSRYVTITAILGLIVLLADVLGALDKLAEFQPLVTKNELRTELDARRAIRVAEQTSIVDDLQKSIGALSSKVDELGKNFATDRVERLAFELSQMRFQRVQMQAQVDDTPNSLQLRGILADMDAAITAKEIALRTAQCEAAGREC